MGFGFVTVAALTKCFFHLPFDGTAASLEVSVERRHHAKIFVAGFDEDVQKHVDDRFGFVAGQFGGSRVVDARIRQDPVPL